MGTYPMSSLKAPSGTTVNANSERFKDSNASNSALRVEIKQEHDVDHDFEESYHASSKPDGGYV